MKKKLANKLVNWLNWSYIKKHISIKGHFIRRDKRYMASYPLCRFGMSCAVPRRCRWHRPCGCWAWPLGCRGPSHPGWLPRRRPWPRWQGSWGPACSRPVAGGACDSGPRRWWLSAPDVCGTKIELGHIGRRVIKLAIYNGWVLQMSVEQKYH